MSTIATPHTHGRETAARSAGTRLAGYLLEFESVDGLHDVARKIRQAGFTRWDIHTPYPVHGLDKSMGVRPTILPVIVFLGGLTGCLFGLFLTCYISGVELFNTPFVPTNLSGYRLPISGKPFFSTQAFIPVIFELTVLFSALTAVFGMLILNGLPKFWGGPLSSARFARVTTDRFFVYVDASDPKFNPQSTAALLREVGGSEPIRVDEPVESAEPPRWLISAGVIAACLGLIPLAIIARARANQSREPRIHIVQDMDNQERFKAQMGNPAFADGRAMRPEVAGTVARGDLRSIAGDPHFTEGLVDNDWAKTLPARVKADAALLARGQSRFAIYCAPCHGLDGRGAGPVAARNQEGRPGWETWVQPTSLHDQSVRDRAHGHLFNTISNGIRTMPPYGTSISTEDRWAIVAYIRALQRSSGATLEDVPEEIRKDLESR